MIWLILLILLLVFLGAGFALHVLWWVLVAIVLVAGVKYLIDRR